MPPKVFGRCVAIQSLLSGLPAACEPAPHTPRLGNGRSKTWLVIEYQPPYKQGSGTYLATPRALLLCSDARRLLVDFAHGLPLARQDFLKKEIRRIDAGSLGEDSEVEKEVTLVGWFPVSGGMEEATDFYVVEDNIPSSIRLVSYLPHGFAVLGRYPQEVPTVACAMVEKFASRLAIFEQLIGPSAPVAMLESQLRHLPANDNDSRYKEFFCSALSINHRTAVFATALLTIRAHLVAQLRRGEVGWFPVSGGMDVATDYYVVEDNISSSIRLVSYLPQGFTVLAAATVLLRPWIFECDWLRLGMDGTNLPFRCYTRAGHSMTPVEVLSMADPTAKAGDQNVFVLALALGSESTWRIDTDAVMNDSISITGVDFLQDQMIDTKHFGRAAGAMIHWLALARSRNAHEALGHLISLHTDFITLGRADAKKGWTEGCHMIIHTIQSAIRLSGGWLGPFKEKTVERAGQNVKRACRKTTGGCLKNVLARSNRRYTDEETDRLLEG